MPIPPLPAPPPAPGAPYVPGSGSIGNQALNPAYGTTPYQVDPGASIALGIGQLISAARHHQKSVETDSANQGMEIIKGMQGGWIPWSEAPRAAKLLQKGKVISAESLTGPAAEQLNTLQALKASQNAGAVSGVQSDPNQSGAPAQMPVSPGSGNLPSLQSTVQPPSMLRRLGQASGFVPRQTTPMDPNSPMAMTFAKLQQSQEMQRSLAMAETHAQVKGIDLKSHMLDQEAAIVKHANDPEWMAKPENQQMIATHEAFGNLKEPSNYRILQHMVYEGKLSQEEADNYAMEKMFGVPAIKTHITDFAMKNAERWGGDMQKGLMYTAATVAPHMFGMTKEQARKIANDPEMQPRMNVDETIKMMGAVRDTLNQLDVPKAFQPLMTSAVIAAHQGNPEAMKIVSNGMQAFGRVNEEYQLKRDAAGLDRRRFAQSLDQFNFDVGKHIYEATKDANGEQWAVVHDPNATPQEKDFAKNNIRSNWKKMGTINVPYRTPDGKTLSVPIGGQYGDTHLERFFNAIGYSNKWGGAASIVPDADPKAYEKYKKLQKSPDPTVLDEFIRGLGMGFAGRPSGENNQPAPEEPAI